MGCRKEIYKGIFPTVFNKIKKQAEEREIEFNVSIEYIGDLFEKQEQKCALTGIILTLKANTKDTSQTASLDRKDNTKGYIEGNLWWIDKRINKLKSDFPQEEFFMLCEKVARHKSKVKITELASLLGKIKK
jgi:hypothetical protein